MMEETRRKLGKEKKERKKNLRKIFYVKVWA